MKKNIDFKVEYKQDENGYRNPLSDVLDNADPCIVYCKKNKYYYGISTGDKTLTMHRAKKLSDMFCNSESKIIYTANDEEKTYGFLWAPELHFIDGKWYIYTSTHQTAENRNFKHVICLEAKTDDPFDGFVLGGHINPEVYAIDPTIYQDKKAGKLYICFSLVVRDSKPRQVLAIQEMKSPTEPTGEYTIIAEPEYDWELIRTPPINEGAYFIEKDGRLFIVYSGNGCWNNEYVLGILEFMGGDILSAGSWVKDEVPLFEQGNGNYGPGHATFFYSPDETELWICHHCLHESNPSVKPMDRHCHCQKVFFDETGFPHLGGMPVPKGVRYKSPSGEPV
jgi:GH43 family beta-xylosidase